MSDNKLISVRVLTYNSASTIIATLDSIYRQTYDNIELVVSDDCSKDDTISVCEKWIKTHRSRFYDVKIITTPVNTGISENINRSVKACSGEWIKGIAGDDLLMPDCISEFVHFVEEHPEANVICSKMQHFQQIGDKIEPMQIAPAEKYVRFLLDFAHKQPYQQFKILLEQGCFIQAPTVFAKRSFIIEHPYNGIYKYEEDYPRWLNMTHDGNRIDYLDKVTVLYRIGESLSHRTSDFHSRNYMHTRSLFFWNECFNYYKQEKNDSAYQTYRKQLLMFELTEAFTQNKKNKLNSLKRRVLLFFVKNFAKYELY